ncbi:hypothetical protein VTJ49DRAFT_1216 [Mycothermus thermophilus]|uniref:Clr5 domain-containing protein n=1 Tax=Humicola insolens TaxID=85995 RepID=A0ABR3VE79_HUMIN
MDLRPPADPAFHDMTGIPKNLAVAPAWLSEANTAPLPSSIVVATLERHSPSPGLIPATTSRTMASTDAVDTQSRTIQGPSAKEWEKHRETIIGLYKQYPLKRVSEIMRTQHGFSASKRMYDKRFREWNVFKNTNSDERIRAARRARMSRASTPPRGSGSHNNFSRDDLRKTMQYQQTRTMSIISHKLGEYYDWQLSHIPEGAVPDDYLGHRTPEESTRYWNTIKNAIYLVKISINSKEDVDLRPDRRAWSTFAEAGQLAAAAMTSQPFDFLRNLFATLSPVNTRARPELRNILLRFLTSEAQRTLSPNHPITHICQELQNDEGSQEISQRSLQCMLDIFNSRLQRSRAITFKLLDSLATLLRRSGEYRAGLEIVTELLHASGPVFGPDSDQVRSVENELAHFYMLTDNADMALGHCMSVVTRPPVRPGEAPSFYQDGIAAHAMEDLAEIHQRRGDLEQCITWLERAASIALVVWGPKDIATSHLVDKMASLQRQLGRDLLESATLWEATIVSEGN